MSTQTTIQLTYTASGELDFDPITLTVRADDGERVSVFDLDWCPRCDGSLTFVSGTWFDPPGADQVLCNDLGCRFHAVRPTSPPRPARDVAGGMGSGGEE